MESGIPVLTTKGRDALKNNPVELTPLCRNILIQMDGKKSLDEIKKMFRGLKGLDEAIERLITGRFIHASRGCFDQISSVANQVLGAKAPTLLKKIDELHAKYGDQCWSHIDEVDKLARMFYGEVVADQLKTEISRILQETGIRV